MLEWLYCPLLRRTDAFISQCCRIATIPRRIRKSKCVVQPRRFDQGRRLGVPGGLAAAAIDLNIEVPDLLAQRVAVQAEEIGGTDLVAAGRGERSGQQRHLDLLQDA